MLYMYIRASSLIRLTEINCIISTFIEDILVGLRSDEEVSPAYQCIGTYFDRGLFILTFFEYMDLNPKEKRVYVRK